MVEDVVVAETEDDGRDDGADSEYDETYEPWGSEEISCDCLALAQLPDGTVCAILLRGEQHERQCGNGDDG